MYRRLGMYLLSALLVLLPVSAVFGKEAHAAGSSRIAIIKSLSGDVQVQKSGGSKQFKAFAKLSLNQGDKLVTGSEGSAVLQFSNGTSEDDKFTVGENATLTFSKLSDKKGTVTKVSMLKGTAWVDVKSIKSKDDDFRLETPTAIMGVRGTAFYASVNPATGGTTTAVLSGVVRLTSDHVEKTSSGSASGSSDAGGSPAAGRKTVDLYPTQQISLDPGANADPGERTIIVDIEDIIKHAPPEVIEAMLRSKEKIDEENKQMTDKFRETGMPPELQQQLEQFMQNTLALLNVIAQQAIQQKKIDETKIKEIEKQEKTKFELGKDQLPQLSEKDKAKQEKAKQLEEEAAKKKEMQEAAKKKDLSDKLAEQIKKVEDAKRALEEANKKALEEARARAEAELLKKLNEQQKQQYQQDKTRNNQGSSPGATEPVPSANLSSNANLGTLTVSVGTLSPAFDAGVTAYSVSVTSDKTSIDVAASVQDSRAAFTINGQSVSGGKRTVSLAYGDNVVDVTVRAQSGAQKTYTLTITRQLLNSVSVVFPGNDGINIDFNAGGSAQPLQIPSGSDSLTLTVPATGPELDISVNGQSVMPLPVFLAALVVQPGQTSWKYVIPLNSETNTIVIKATIDGVVKSYTLIAQRAMSSETAVKSVEARSADDAAQYAVSQTASGTWTVSVPADTATLKLRIATLNAAAKVLLGTGEYASEATIPYTIVNLNVPFRVKAADGTQKDFLLKIVKLPSANANLAGLELWAGAISPTVVANGATSYTANVGNATGSIQVKPTAAHSEATVKVNGSTVPNGSMSGPIALNAGANTITIEVTAQDGTKKQYTVTVTRENAALPTPVFNPPSGAVAFGTPVTISSEGAEHIYYTTDGSDPATSVTGATKEYSASSKPTIGSAGMFKAIATRAGYPNSAVGSAEYTQAATADLTEISLSGAVNGFSFNGSTYLYDAVTAPNDVSSLTVKVLGANTTGTARTITVNGTVVPSGDMSPRIELGVGVATTITVVATEEGKSSKTYIIKVTRSANANANLSALTLSDGTLSPKFASGVATYTAYVPYETTQLTVTATVEVPTSSVTINGQSADQPISLVVGTNTVSVDVASQSGLAKSYTISVTRHAASQDATLSSLEVPGQTLVPVFNPVERSYTLAVPYSTDGLVVNATASSQYAQIAGAGPHALNVGENVIPVTVTAQDGVTVLVYKLTVTRHEPLSSDATLSSLLVSPGTLEPEFSPVNHSYTVTVPGAVDSIHITATANAQAATVAGDGDHALHVGDNELTVTVTAEDQSTGTYLIKVVRPSENLSLVHGTTAWTDVRSDDADVVWHVNEDYMYDAVLYTELPDESVTLVSAISFDESITEASLRREGSEETLASYDGGSTMNIEFGPLEAGDNVFMLHVYDVNGGAVYYKLDIKVGGSLPALANMFVNMDREHGSLTASRIDTHHFTLIVPDSSTGFTVYLVPDSVASDLEVVAGDEGYGVEMGSFYVGAGALDQGWNRLTVKMKDIAGHAAPDTIIDVWLPSEEETAGPASLSLNLDDMAFVNDGQSFYPTSMGEFGFYNVATHGRSAELSFSAALADPESTVDAVFVVNSGEEGEARTELSPDVEGQYSFDLAQGDNIEIVVRDAGDHRFRHWIHIEHTLDPEESLLPRGVHAWSIGDVGVKKNSKFSRDYYYVALPVTQSSPAMTLSLDPAVYAEAELYAGSEFAMTASDPVASWTASEDESQAIEGSLSGYNMYTLVLYPVDEEEEIGVYKVTIGNGPASIYGLSLWETLNGGDFAVDAGWANTGTDEAPVYQGYIYSTFRYLRMDMNFDKTLVSDAALEEADSAAPLAINRYKEEGYYEFDMNGVSDGLHHLKLTVTEADGSTKHVYDLYVHFIPRDNGVARVTADIAGLPVAWMKAEGIETATEEGQVKREYAILPADQGAAVMHWSMTLAPDWIEKMYEFVDAAIDGIDDAVQIDDNGQYASGVLTLSPGYHDIKARYKSHSPMQPESDEYFVREWIVFVGDPSHMADAPEAGLDGSKLMLTTDDSFESGIPLEGEGRYLQADVAEDVDGIFLQVAAYSPYSRVDVLYMNERPYEIAEGRFNLSMLHEGSNPVTIKVTDPTGTIETEYTLEINKQAGGGGSPGTAPRARINSLSVGGHQLPMNANEDEFILTLPFEPGPAPAMTVHAVADGQAHVDLTVNGSAWQWDDDTNTIMPDDEGNYVLNVTSTDGAYSESVYRVRVVRLLTSDATIDGEVPMIWTSGSGDSWNSDALELEDGEWLRMNFGTAAGYHLEFAVDGGELDGEAHDWYLDSGPNKLTVYVKSNMDNSVAAQYEFNAYNWNSMLVANATADKDADRVQAIKWDGQYYATVPISWFSGASEQKVNIYPKAGQGGGNQLTWNFTGQMSWGNYQLSDAAGNHFARKVSVYAADMPDFMAKFENSGYGWVSGEFRYPYGHDERPGLYFWSGSSEALPAKVDLSALQSAGDMHVYAMNDDATPLDRAEMEGRWTWNLPLDSFNSNGVTTFKVVVTQNGNRSVYLLSFGIGNDPLSA
ncbi:cadherin-like beta sandwich domain-containing protein [Cohnella sp. 56]|uniref:cadherin-like beta sandwich domain-containing protein n=1 Tax=Cohnella sp. 56 TaxID=3113722 RepID=UPI0030E9A134